MTTAEMPEQNLGEALSAAYPELAAVGAGDGSVYLVGGAVRDLLLGRGRADIDLVVVGDAAALAVRLGSEAVEHERFGTVKAVHEGHQLDIAGARTETYPYPGALPVVEPAVGIEDDLARRDFTINAMALPLSGEVRLVDPHGGRDDLGVGLLRILHPNSFIDDPTRAIRAARYAARFGFELEPETERLLRATDLTTVSVDRRRSELLRLAVEATAPRGFELLADWGLVELREGGPELAAKVAELLGPGSWAGFAPLGWTVLAAALGPEGPETELVETRPERPSRGVELAQGYDPVELVLARALGVAWLDQYVREWRQVELEIGGADLIAAGLPEGPALGEGLAAALRAKLDGEVGDREGELAVALAAAGPASA